MSCDVERFLDVARLGEYFFHYVVVLSDALGDAHLEATQHDRNKTEALFSKMDTDEGTRFRFLPASTGAADHIKDLVGFLTGGCLVENRLQDEKACNTANTTSILCQTTSQHKPLVKHLKGFYTLYLPSDNTLNGRWSLPAKASARVKSSGI